MEEDNAEDSYPEYQSAPCHLVDADGREQQADVHL